VQYKLSAAAAAAVCDVTRSPRRPWIAWVAPHGHQILIFIWKGLSSRCRSRQRHLDCLQRSVTEACPFQMLQTGIHRHMFDSRVPNSCGCCFAWRCPAGAGAAPACLFVSSFSAMGISPGRSRDNARFGSPQLLTNGFCTWPWSPKNSA